MLTIGVYLDDVTDDMSPMGVIPDSHNGPLYNLYDESGQWTGALNDEDIAALALDSAVYLGGRAGSITAHNCRCVHGSAPNRAPRPRPLLLCAYSAAHAIPITNLTAKSKYGESSSEARPQSGQNLTHARCYCHQTGLKSGISRFLSTSKVKVEPACFPARHRLSSNAIFEGFPHSPPKVTAHSKAKDKAVINEKKRRDFHWDTVPSASSTVGQCEGKRGQQPSTNKNLPRPLR